MKRVISIMLLALAAVAFGDWTSIGPEGGPIYSGTVVPTNPPTVYVAASATGLPLLKSNDGGANWLPAGAALSGYPYALVAHPTDTNTLYGVYSSIFYRTTDAGLTWTTTSLGSNTNGNDIAINPLNPAVIYVVCYKYDGAAWKPSSAKSLSCPICSVASGSSFCWNRSTRDQSKSSSLTPLHGCRDFAVVS